MIGTAKKCLWVFGNAVQDITVEVDIERLTRELDDDKRNAIHLGEQGPEIRPELWLKTQIGSKEFGVEVAMEESELSKDGESVLSKDGDYVLRGGRKYKLKGSVVDSHELISEEALFLPCENLSWGGGGANVVTFIRALSPNSDAVPVRYTDIAMDVSLPKVMERFLRAVGPFSNALPNRGSFDFDGLLQRLRGIDRVKTEIITRKVAAIAADYSPERSLTVYLASLSVESVLYRPTVPHPRRNWVFSRFRSAYGEVNNKIILKGNFPPLRDDEEEKITDILAAHSKDVGAILINSIKDAPLFKAAYSFCEARRDDPNFVAILALTETSQDFVQWMVKRLGDNRHFPPFILVLNETEAYKLAMARGGPSEPFMKDDDLPDMRLFAKMADALRNQFDRNAIPRIYVTIGAKGSLGVDSSGHVIYVSSFSKRGATVYDTNACGDAYCATIALLEWAKRQGDSPFGDSKGQKMDFGTAEMEYFMAVATASAYCKATNRRGRVYAAEVADLLQYNHLASAVLWTVDGFLNPVGKPPDCIDAKFRLREPTEARFVGVTKELSRLIT